jgi:threonine aldolase
MEFHKGASPLDAQGRPVLDFRSDTVTRPTAAMRAAMAAAEVGDDVMGEDPTINLLEERVAALFGRQAALFLPSSTMANLCAIAVHCTRGSEIILERRTHSVAHEVTGASSLLGAAFWPVDIPDGRITPDHIRGAFRAPDVHHPRSRLVIAENTINLAGGLVQPVATIGALYDTCRELGLALHLDGARIWNAATALGVPLVDFGSRCDTLACCLSKGLGCPAGALLVGDRATIDEARWYRKMFGGGMRQVGILAAAGLYALDHELPRLGDDHNMAHELAAALSALDRPWTVQAPESNMVLLRCHTPADCLDQVGKLAEAGILAYDISALEIRLVCHRDLPRDAAARVAERLA